MKRVVFICSGNICRSPMAAALARTKLDAQGIEALVISQGTLNINGAPAAAEAVQALSAIGVALEAHRSQGVSIELLKQADHVVVMAPQHQDFLTSRAPELATKIQPMWEFADPSLQLQEIADPVGQDLEAFIRCRDELDACLDRWVSHIKKLH